MVEIDGQPSKDLPTTLYMKDCQMNDVARGITVNLRNWADNRTLASRIQLQNVSITGKGEQLSLIHIFPFLNDKYFRLCFMMPEDNDRLLAVLKKLAD